MTKVRVAATTALLTAAAINIALLLTARLTGSEVTHEEQRLILVGFLANALAILAVVALALAALSRRRR